MSLATLHACTVPLRSLQSTGHGRAVSNIYLLPELIIRGNVNLCIILGYNQVHIIADVMYLLEPIAIILHFI